MRAIQHVAHVAATTPAVQYQPKVPRGLDSSRISPPLVSRKSPARSKSGCPSRTQKSGLIVLRFAGAREALRFERGLIAVNIVTTYPRMAADPKGSACYLLTIGEAEGRCRKPEVRKNARLGRRGRGRKSARLWRLSREGDEENGKKLKRQKEETGAGRRRRLGRTRERETRMPEDWRQKPEEESPICAWALCYLCELLFNPGCLSRHGRKTRYLLLQR